eukprot:sb/3461991/
MTSKKTTTTTSSSSKSVTTSSSVVTSSTSSSTLSHSLARRTVGGRAALTVERPTETSKNVHVSVSKSFKSTVNGETVAEEEESWQSSSALAPSPSLLDRRRTSMSRTPDIDRDGVVIIRNTTRTFVDNLSKKSEPAKPDPPPAITITEPTPEPTYLPIPEPPTPTRRKRKKVTQETVEETTKETVKARKEPKPTKDKKAKKDPPPLVDEPKKAKEDPPADEPKTSRKPPRRRRPTSPEFVSNDDEDINRTDEYNLRTRKVSKEHTTEEVVVAETKPKPKPKKPKAKKPKRIKTKLSKSDSETDYDMITEHNLRDRKVVTEIVEETVKPKRSRRRNVVEESEETVINKTSIVNLSETINTIVNTSETVNITNTENTNTTLSVTNTEEPTTEPPPAKKTPAKRPSPRKRAKTPEVEEPVDSEYNLRTRKVSIDTEAVEITNETNTTTITDNTTNIIKVCTAFPKDPDDTVELLPTEVVEESQVVTEDVPEKPKARAPRKRKPSTTPSTEIDKTSRARRVSISEHVTESYLTTNNISETTNITEDQTTSRWALRSRSVSREDPQRSPSVSQEEDSGLGPSQRDDEAPVPPITPRKRRISKATSPAPKKRKDRTIVENITSLFAWDSTPAQTPAEPPDPLSTAPASTHSSSPPTPVEKEPTPPPQPSLLSSVYSYITTKMSSASETDTRYTLRTRKVDRSPVGNYSFPRAYSWSPEPAPRKRKTSRTSPVRANRVSPPRGRRVSPPRRSPTDINKKSPVIVLRRASPPRCKASSPTRKVSPKRQKSPPKASSRRVSPISIITELQDGSEDELRHLTATSEPESIAEIETFSTTAFSTADTAPQQVKVGRKSPNLQELNCDLSFALSA